VSEAGAYFSYLLRIWQIPVNGEKARRILLENIQTGEKRGFSSLEELTVYLNQVSSQENQTSGEGSQTEVQG
jgi:hypothetical protein